MRTQSLFKAYTAYINIIQILYKAYRAFCKAYIKLTQTCTTFIRLI